MRCFLQAWPPAEWKVLKRLAARMSGKAPLFEAFQVSAEVMHLLRQFEVFLVVFRVICVFRS